MWTRLCGRVVSIIHWPRLIFTCLWTSGRVLTKALTVWQDNESSKTDECPRSRRQDHRCCCSLFVVIVIIIIFFLSILLVQGHIVQQILGDPLWKSDPRHPTEQMLMWIHLQQMFSDRFSADVFQVQFFVLKLYKSWNWVMREHRRIRNRVGRVPRGEQQQNHVLLTLSDIYGMSPWWQ